MDSITKKWITAQVQVEERKGKLVDEQLKLNHSKQRVDLIGGQKEKDRKLKDEQKRIGIVRQWI